LIENLSNELFYEIFDYLNGLDIYRSFYQLNHRFNELLIQSSILYKIKLSSDSTLDLFQSTSVLDSKISSLSCSHDVPVNKIFINRSFPNLQSIHLKEISEFNLSISLFYFKSLPCLRSLKICLDYFTSDLGDLYQIIFQFPHLKHLSMDINDNADDDPIITMIQATQNQYSSIEHLKINHYIDISQLTILLSYTPRLSRLCCLNIIESNDEIEQNISRTLVNLVELSISFCELKFDQFTKFLVQFCSNLKSIHFTAYAEDKDYLNAIRWEQLISKNLTCLDQFHFHYTELYYDDFEVTAKHELLKGFASPFWKERQWSLSLSVIEYEIIYRITPLKYSFILKFLRYFILIFFYLHRKSSFSTHHRYHLMNDWTPLSIWHSVLAKKDQRFMTNFSQLIKTLGITFLNIDCSRVSPMTLLNLFNCVQNLHSIRISSLPLKTKLLKANLDQWNLFIENNKIIYVTLPNVSDLKRFDLILEFFPLMKHLTLNIDSPDDFEEAVQSVLSKLKKRKNHNINSICFIVAEIENDKIPQLEKLIDSKKLVKNFTFTREYENFYLKFK